jgi:LuxR family maltose regulon positive regulatory protein
MMMKANLQKQNKAGIICTKLAVPQLPKPRLSRTALLERLNAGLQHRMTLISAAAGSGKTTLAVEWVLSLQQSDGLDAAWVSFDSGDNDPLRFWRYVFTALQSLEPEAGRIALGLLEASQSPSFESALTAVINQLASREDRCLLVFEDYQAITNPEIHSAVSFLIDHLPAALHLLVLTRSDPPLPLARLRARSEINELRAIDLRFSAGESEEFLRQAVNVPLQPDTIARLAARTEGWPAGLRLAALALQSRPEPQAQEQFLETFTGSHRPILDYLAEDVLAAQPEHIQRFLLQTSFLIRLSGSLCDAVTGRSDGAETLDTLERLNLFLEPLDGAGEWYRFHPLFSEAMQHIALQRLGAEHLCQAAEAASRWYELHALENPALLYDAVESALQARAAERAAGLIERYIRPRLSSNEFHTLLRWIQSLPPSVLSGRPKLAFAYAQALMFTRDPGTPGLTGMVAGPLEMAEEVWRVEGDAVSLGEALAFRSLLAARQGDYPAAFSLARRALEHIPGDITPTSGSHPTGAEWRAISLNFTAWEDLFTGNLHAALQAFSAARSLFQAVRNDYGLLDSTAALGDVHAGMADVRQAAEYYQQALAASETAPINHKDRLRRRGRSLAGLARLALEQNDLQTVEEMAVQAQQIAREIGSDELLVRSAVILAQVDRAHGDQPAAAARLRTLSPQIRQPQFTREIQAWLAWLALSAGDLTTVRRWAASLQQFNGHPAGVPYWVIEREKLTLARFQITSGNAESALHKLDGLLESAHAQGRVRSEIEMQIIRARALVALERPQQAREALSRALELTGSRGYQRLFLDEGDALAGLLPSATAAQPERLLQTSGAGRSTDNIPSPPVPAVEGWELLSSQEERVLRLLAAGYTNPEIAQELYISVNTVKTHVKSVYRKLNIDNRRAARRAVRRLQLMPHSLYR